MIYEKIIESMSSKESEKECAKDDCQKEMKRMIFDKMEETITKKPKNCVVCYEERNGTFALLPCGHAKICETCCVKTVEETKTCPLCRGNVSKYQKIFD